MAANFILGVSYWGYWQSKGGSRTAVGAQRAFLVDQVRVFERRAVYHLQHSSTGWFKVPPPVTSSPAVPFCTRVPGMKPTPGRDSSVNMTTCHATQHISVNLVTNLLTSL